MPTAIGLIFIIAGLYFFFRKRDHLFSLLLFSTIFPATSAITFGSLWIMPYYVVAPLFILSQMLRGGLGRRFRGGMFLIAFTCLGVFSAIVYPLIFVGIPVYSPRLGSSDLVFQTFPLSFSVANIAQAGYLIVNTLVVFAAVSAFKSDKVWKGVHAAFYCMMGTIAAELACIFVGIPFPYTIIENSPERASLQLQVLDPTARLQGTCGEPSYAGVVLITFFAVYFYRSYTSGKDGWKAFFSAVALFLVRSSTSLITLAVVTGLIIVFNLPVRAAAAVGSSSIVRTRQLLRLIVIASMIAISFTSPTIQGLVQDWVLDKSETGSYEHRTAMDRYSLNLAQETLGIGVGLGSYRPSSLLASLLGNVGLLGILLFGLAFFIITLGVPRDKAWMRWALIAALIDMAIAIPDITEPFLWALTALVLYVSVPDKSNFGYSPARQPYGAFPRARPEIVQPVDL